MKTNKILKILSIIFECFGFGSLILYIYNLVIASKKYETIPETIKTRINLFLFIALMSFAIFGVIKYILYLRNKANKKVTKKEQLQMDFPSDIEKEYKNLEAPVNERIFVYKDDYEVPKDRRQNCPNCGNSIDKNAFICIKCGYLLQPIETIKGEEKIIEKPVYIDKPVYVDKTVYVDKPVYVEVEKPVYIDKPVYIRSEYDHAIYDDDIENFEYDESNENISYKTDYNRKEATINSNKTTQVKKVKNTKTKTKKKWFKGLSMDAIINICLIAAIVVCVLLISYMAKSRGVIM